MADELKDAKYHVGEIMVQGDGYRPDTELTTKAGKLRKPWARIAEGQEESAAKIQTPGIQEIITAHRLYDTQPPFARAVQAQWQNDRAAAREALVDVMVEATTGALRRDTTIIDAEGQFRDPWHGTVARIQNELFEQGSNLDGMPYKVAVRMIENGTPGFVGAVLKQARLDAARTDRSELNAVERTTRHLDDGAGLSR